MLPDFPKVKAKIEAFLFRRIHISQNQAAPFLEGIDRVLMTEGDDFLTVWDDGTEHRTEFKHISATRAINAEEFTNMSPEKIISLLDEVVQEMARQQSEHFFAEMSRVTQAVGNSIDGRGEQLSAEFIFRMLERIQLPFDEHGRPQLPNVAAGPKLAERMQNVLAEIQTNPALRRRMATILEAKKEQWRDRESGRKLVG